MEKPKQCCRGATNDHAVPMPIRRRVEYVDFCVAEIVAALNAAGVPTNASCCGHGKANPYIVLWDDRIIEIWPSLKKWQSKSAKG